MMNFDGCELLLCRVGYMSLVVCKVLVFFSMVMVGIVNVVGDFLVWIISYILFVFSMNREVVGIR